MTARTQAAAWALRRPGKKPAELRGEDLWQAELRHAGYDPAGLRRPSPRPPVSLDDLRVQEVASRALDRCAAAASAWTVHTIQEHVTRITTEHGVRAAPEELRQFIAIATRLALDGCFSVLPSGAPAPEHVAHLSSLPVPAADMTLRNLLQTGVPTTEPARPDLAGLAAGRGLDADQAAASAAIASTDPLVIVEGAAGAGKTTMLGAAIEISRREGRAARIVTPTLRAAQAAEQELGVPAASVAALVHAHGWRWNSDGVWTRLKAEDLDPAAGTVYTGPPEAARLAPGERIIVDEAGMLDQDTAIALLTVAKEAGATVVLVGDRAQLPAVGRGGVLDVAAQAEADGASYLAVVAHEAAAQARQASAQAAAARQRAAQLRSLPLGKAAALIDAERASAEQAARASAERARRLRHQPQPAPSTNDPRHTRPGLGL
ncbi:MAG: AAA family ATPase [Bifidobacteriaceae bacterium]|nr:AAA family ATPase [Bifidobacteriaceae bacterium]